MSHLHGLQVGNLQFIVIIVRPYLIQKSVLTFVKSLLNLSEEIGEVDVIAGVATGAVAIGALVAEELGKPFVYIRSSSKGHGLQNKIEGVVESGQSVVVIEDLISTGGSSLKAVEALRSAGCNVKALVAIFTYGFEVSEKAFEDANCPLITLTDYEMLIEQALDSGYVTESEVASLKEWRKSPSIWGV